MKHTDDTVATMTLAEIGTSYQAVQATVCKAQRKVAAALLERLGHAVVDLARDDAQRYDYPRVLR